MNRINCHVNSMFCFCCCCCSFLFLFLIWLFNKCNAANKLKFAFATRATRLVMAWWFVFNLILFFCCCCYKFFIHFSPLSLWNYYLIQFELNIFTCLFVYIYLLFDSEHILFLLFKTHFVLLIRSEWLFLVWLSQIFIFYLFSQHMIDIELMHAHNNSNMYFKGAQWTNLLKSNIYDDVIKMLLKNAHDEEAAVWHTKKT